MFAAFSRESELIPIVDPGGDFYGELFNLLLDACALAIAAWRSDDLAVALAGWAGRRHRDKTTIHEDLAPALACAARLRLGSGLCPGAAAMLTDHGPSNGDFFFDTCQALVE